MIFSPPVNCAFYHTVLDLSTNGYVVDVLAGIDILHNQAFWTFTTLDPNTGAVPSNPQIGFLPPDSSPPNGEGFVSYSVRPAASVTTGTTVAAQATIVFDNQPPMPTTFAYNKLEVGAPTSNVLPLPAVVADPIFNVSWQGLSVPGGDGIASYDVYVSENGSAFVAWLQGSTLLSSPFTGERGSTYAFYSLARANSGTVQTAPAVADTLTFVSTNQPPLIGLLTNIVVAPDGVASERVRAADPNGDNVAFGLTVAPPGAAINPTNGTFRWAPGRSYANTTNQITVTATDNGVPPLSTNASFFVTVLDYLDLALGSTNVQSGQNASLPVVVSSSEGVTNLSFTVQVMESILTNLSVQAAAPQVGSASLADTISNIVIVVSTGAGQTLQGQTRSCN